MEIPRKILVPSIVLVMALSIIIGFIFIRKKSISGGNPLKAIPIDASFVLKINNFHKLSNSIINENKIWNDFSSISPFKDLTKDILYLDSLIKNNAFFGELSLNSNSYISAHYIGGRKTDFLFIVNMKEGLKLKSIIDFLNGLSHQDIEKTIRKYEGKSIYTLKIINGLEDQNFYFSMTEGNIIFSKSVILIENSLRQLSLSNSMLDDDEFRQILTTTGKNKVANLYINLHKLSGLSSSLACEPFRSKLKGYNQFGGWSELDINLDENKIILNGFLNSEERKDLFLNIFDNCKPIKLTYDKILPSNVSAFISIGIDDPLKMNQSMIKYFETIDKKKLRDKRIREIEDKYDFKADDLFLSMIDNEITMANCTLENQGNQKTTYVIIKCKSGNQSKKQLAALVDQICRKKALNIQSVRSKYTFDNETETEITEFPIENITGLVFGGLFDIKDKTYFTFIGNYLVFGQSLEALGNIIYNNILNKTLTTNEIYKDFSNNIGQKSFLIFYTNLSRSASFFKDYLDPKIINSWNRNNTIFQKVQPFGMQITLVSNMKYCNVLTQYSDALNSKPQTVWESLLDTVFEFKPQLLVNHYTKENEIFIQDLNNTIYLISKSGRILWKQKITEPINSKIYQIDYFGNNKLQILFSTKNFLHLIDRNGNYVERYPIRLRSEASSGLSVYDYDLDKNYRIFIPCIDNKIYAYTKEGTLINGWHFEGSDYPVDQPVNHFRIGEKDFIVFGDKFHTYILDRKGQQRVVFNQEIIKSRNNNYILDENNTPEKSRILITDSTGTIISIYFDGHSEKTTVGTFNPDHFFDFKDMDADGSKDFIFLNDNTLNVYRQNKSKIFTFQFPHVIKERPVYYRFSYIDRKLGLVDAEDQKIYLLNNDGTLYKDFPLEGTTMFSIGNLEVSNGKFNLIVGGRNNFLYNYSVQ
jgi:hypothetical protein